MCRSCLLADFDYLDFFPHGFRNLESPWFISLFGNSAQSIQNSGQESSLETSGKGFGNMDILIIHWYSQDYYKEDYLYSLSWFVLHVRD